MKTAISLKYPKETQWQENYAILTEQIDNLRSYLQLGVGTKVIDGKKNREDSN